MRRGGWVAAVAAGGLFAGAYGAALAGWAPIERALAVDGVSASRAGEVLDAWADFPVGAPSRPVVLLGSGIREPRFDGRADRIAYRVGRWTLPAMPPAPAGALAAAQAVELLRAEARRGYATYEVRPTGPAEITRVRLGTARFRTDRGEARLPAWYLVFRGAHGAAVVPAGAPDVVFRAPAPLDPASGGAARVTRDGLTIRTAHSEGICSGTPYLEARESPTAVVLLVRHTPVAPGPNPRACPAMLKRRPLETRLRAPLGNRVVLTEGGVPVDMAPRKSSLLEFRTP